ncbi:MULTISPECIES: phosphate ABC transporter permease subunit PstC [Nocardiopsis]|jgi:phosphate transport system permease protein|uniref:Phosphate transport system permease protein n=2 Tax=Nocardiopsis alba TaxID=53437 RepID=A0A7K2IRG7_9ACTN|nr:MULTISPECIES: phosphate ABC transporter permease subunit PstC [Nocardiopsis]AFR06058.1 phosphate ABC transporter, permease protein PstC [Nocardiopsis alba ATCC BAA-2165]MEC3892527.1 phosphate ABC transporter permease subunit PstC [Nocardiopsis sp. LDBS1602]MYR32541.1 phosphate ABC transporter permease subunit PstC [Nocardiopsis alba]
MTTTDSPKAAPPPAGKRRIGDVVFAGLARGSGILILLILAGVAAFLLVQAWPSLMANTSNFLTDQSWDANSRENPSFGVAALAFGTVLAATIALALATPVAIGIALFIVYYAPRRLAATLGYLVDLLAAIPSVVYGLWGMMILAPKLVPVYEGMTRYLGWIPLFAGPASTSARTLLTAGIVLAVMILPIITAMSRDVFQQVPQGHREAALAMGATRWEMIRLAVLPFGKSGIVGGAMLGMGRALGETMAVAMILSPSLAISFDLLQSGNQTIAAHIALQYPEATGYGVSALIAAGLVLFAITLAVNMGARYVVARGNKESA